MWEQLYAPDGAVTTLEDAANGNWSDTYDALNRLLAAQCSANCPDGQASLDLDWTYDRLGNRWSQAPTAGVASTASASFTGKDNRMDTDSYDAAGNLLGDGSHTYTYDAENRIIGVGGNATASYAYDAEGRRVSTTVASGTTLRFFDQQGRTVRRIAAAGQWLSSEIYALGQPLATYDQSGAKGMAWFLDLDPVGTVRTLTNGSGQFAQACTSLPFGDGQACSPAISDPSPLHFTGQPRDAETGLDYFGFRYNSSTLGRWMTPDPAGNLVASPANPQSWNQYAYVRNNPATLVDPFGLFGTDPAMCSTSAGMAYCPGTSVTVNGGTGGIINPIWTPTPIGSIIGDIGTGSAPGGGGGGGDSQKSTPQADSTCLDNFYSSRVGTWVNFASPLSIFWGPNQAEAGVELIGGGGTKAAAVYSSAEAGKISLVTLNGEISIASKLDSILGAVGSKFESMVASAPATLPIIAAMSMDLRVHAACYADAVDPGATERVQSNPEILLIQ